MPLPGNQEEEPIPDPTYPRNIGAPLGPVAPPGRSLSMDNPPWSPSGGRPTFPMPERRTVSRASIGTGAGGGPDLPDIGDLPEYELPEMGELPEFQEIEAPTMPTFEAPKWDEGAIEKAAARKAAPAVRALREGLREMTANTGNDPISRNSARQAITGLGTGLSSIMAGAHTQAVQEYTAKYGYEYGAKAMQFEADADAVAMKYKGDLATNMMKYETEVDQIMTKYAAEVGAGEMQYMAEFERMMLEYKMESEASMLQYETKAARRRLEMELRQRSRELDFNAAMADWERQMEQGAGAERGSSRYPDLGRTRGAGQPHYPGQPPPIVY